MGAEPPGSEPGVAHRTEAPRRSRQTPAQRRTQLKRKQRRRTYVIAAIVGVLLIGAIVAQRVSSNRSSAAFAKLASAAGCGEVRSTGTSGSGQHLRPGETTTYDTSPPTHGKHAASPLAAGVYEEPLSDDPGKDQNIFRAVHSLEHGAIIVWYDKLSDDQLDALDRHLRSERKVLVVPYPPLKGGTHIALTAWGKLVDCERPSNAFIDEFIERYRESPDAPEPKALLS